MNFVSTFYGFTEKSIFEELVSDIGCQKLKEKLPRFLKIITLDLLPFNKQPSENIFSRYFPLKNKSVALLCTDFLKKTIEKIYNSYNYFLKSNKSIKKNFSKI